MKNVMVICLLLASSAIFAGEFNCISNNNRMNISDEKMYSEIEVTSMKSGELVQKLYYYPILMCTNCSMDRTPKGAIINKKDFMSALNPLGNHYLNIDSRRQWVELKNSSNKEIEIFECN